MENDKLTIDEMIQQLELIKKNVEDFKGYERSYILKNVDSALYWLYIIKKYK